MFVVRSHPEVDADSILHNTLVVINKNTNRVTTQVEDNEAGRFHIKLRYGINLGNDVAVLTSEEFPALRS